jgi:hypothetical protein
MTDPKPERRWYRLTLRRVLAVLALFVEGSLLLIGVLFKSVNELLVCVILFDAWLVTILVLKCLGIRQVAGLSLRSFTFREQIALAAATLVLNALLLEMLIVG